MKLRIPMGLLFAALAALSVGTALRAGEMTWVAHTAGMTEGATVLDVADLADGETRTVGAGEKQITLTREGDTVRIVRPASGDDGEITTVCTLGTDRCKVLTFEDDPARIMVLVERTRHCVDGQGDCEAHVEALSSGPGSRQIIVEKVVEPGMDEAEDVVMVRAGGPGHMAFIESESGKVTLRCPEGDATLRVDADEAASRFLCPKHGVEMVKGAAEPRIHRIQMRHPAPNEQ